MTLANPPYSLRAGRGRGKYPIPTEVTINIWVKTDVQRLADESISTEMECPALRETNTPGELQTKDRQPSISDEPTQGHDSKGQQRQETAGPSFPETGLCDFCGESHLVLLLSIHCLKASRSLWTVTKYVSFFFLFFFYDLSFSFPFG